MIPYYKKLASKIFGIYYFDDQKLKEVLGNKVVVRLWLMEGNTGGIFNRHLNFQLLKIIISFCFCNTLKSYFLRSAMFWFDRKWKKIVQPTNILKLTTHVLSLSNFF